jgi:predicted Fe-S protein YdhL (DUF1289 family)|tara:strand:+ start:55 stop:312 length:258 start_codon:yes stop_codon:yes gene_type:complete
MAQKSLHRTTSLADSPCIGTCSVTQWGDTTCKGCGRTDQEIREWNTYSDNQKKLIVINCWNLGYTPRQKRELEEDLKKSNQYPIN